MVSAARCVQCQSENLFQRPQSRTSPSFRCRAEYQFHTTFFGQISIKSWLVNNSCPIRTEKLFPAPENKDLPAVLDFDDLNFVDGEIDLQGCELDPVLDMVPHEATIDGLVSNCSVQEYNVDGITRKERSVSNGNYIWRYNGQE